MTRSRNDERLSPRPDPSGWLASEWPRYLDAPLERVRTPFVTVAAVAIAASFDLAVRSGLVGVAGALCIALAAALIIASGRLRNRQSYVLVAAAPLFGMWLVVRGSAWLFPLNAVAACGLVVLGASLSAGGSIFDLSITRVIARALQAVTQGLLAPAFVLSGRREKRKVAGVVRGLLIAFPVLLVLGVLLASADAVFASFVRFDVANVIAHVVLLAFGALATAALFRLASVSYVQTPEVRGPVLGTSEWTVVLVALNALLGAFAVARIIALSEGGRRVITSAGLTYAEYARTGFFQLLFAAVLAVGVIAALRATAERRTPAAEVRFTVLSMGVVVLTLALVVSAFHRLVLYESAFGLTMLRLYAQTAIVFVGLVLVMLGATILGVGQGVGEKDGVWVWSAAGIAAVVMLFGMNVLNPEAFVAAHNITHQARTGQSDTSYLSELGDDAVPVVVEHKELHGYLCTVSEKEPFTGWASYNASHARADRIRSQVCGHKDKIIERGVQR
jgi:hypothetical protein